MPRHIGKGLQASTYRAAGSKYYPIPTRLRQQVVEAAGTAADSEDRLVFESCQRLRPALHRTSSKTSCSLCMYGTRGAARRQGRLGGENTPAARRGGAEDGSELEKRICMLRHLVQKVSVRVGMLPGVVLPFLLWCAL